MARNDVEDWFWRVGTELQRLSEELHRTRPSMASARFWEPRIDLIEEEHRFLLKAEIAGVKGEDIQVLYIPERHCIQLRGLRLEEDLSEKGKTGIHQLEIFYGEFQREVPLPESAVDATGMRAQYRNGFLIVMVPKMDRIVVSKRVTVRKG